MTLRYRVPRSLTHEPQHCLCNEREHRKMKDQHCHRSPVVGHVRLGPVDGHDFQVIPGVQVASESFHRNVLLREGLCRAFTGGYSGRYLLIHTLHAISKHDVVKTVVTERCCRATLYAARKVGKWSTGCPASATWPLHRQIHNSRQS